MTSSDASPRVPSPWTWLATVIGVLPAVATIMCFTALVHAVAGSFSGHQVVSLHRYTVPGVVAVVVGLVALIGAVMPTGRNNSAAPDDTPTSVRGERLILCRVAFQR